jgi:hypothetical protein
MKIGFNRDWYNRKKENAYSFYDNTKKYFNWEDDYDTRSNGYSSYFVRDNENLKSAAKMIGSMFRVMGVPKKMKLEHSISKKTSGSEVTVPVPLNMLRDEEGNYLNKDTQLLDAFYGASIQNAALSIMQSKQEYVRTMNARDVNANLSPKDLFYSILNTERVDKKLASRFPGYSKFVQKFKEYKYDKNYQPLDASEHAGKRLLELVTKFLRYPANITEEEIKEFEKPLSKIEKYIKKHGFPVTGQDCDKQAAFINGVVKSYIKEEDEDKNPSDQLSESELGDTVKKLTNELINGANGEETTEFNDEFSDFTDDVEDQEKINADVRIDYEKEGSSLSGPIKFIAAGSDKDVYMRELAEIDTVKASVLANLFKRKCKDYKFAMKSMRSGRLDTNKIAEAKQNVPTIYERFGEVKTNKLNIGVLIDESGSMGGYGKIQKARQTAIFMNEVFKNVPDARLYIYGHTADAGPGVTYGDCAIRTYKEDGKNIDRYALGSIDDRHNNRDGDAIYAVAKRIRSLNNDPCLLFVVSDGQPYAYNYDGKAAIEDTRKKVMMSEALDFQVIQIAIEEGISSKEMFNQYIKMTDIKNLPNDLINFASRKIDKLIKSKTVL